MQILADSSEEGKMQGLGWINGQVKKFNRTALPDGAPLPHMGWNTINLLKPETKIVKALNNKSRFYFLHSYYFACNDSNNVIATTEYGDNFASIINCDNVYGIQCHPEKSHLSGITLLKNFGEL